MHIYITNTKTELKFLRRKTELLNFSAFPKKELRHLIRDMRRIMREAQGVGLSANQIGLPYRIFIAQVPDAQNREKFYVMINPEIVKTSTVIKTLEEGCLSVPITYGPVDRPYQIVIESCDVDGKKMKMKAWGLLARVFQHEMDHLNGILFVDKAASLRKYENKNKITNS